jgi:phthiodiolone/phenolphthiodiolone dimycocerosates ketoreductase
MKLEFNVKFGFKVPFYPLELIFESASYAENHGCDSIWTADHIVGISVRKWDCFSSWCILSSLAIKSKKALLGPSVTDACRIHPSILAHKAMTIHNLSRGRFILGIGAGEAQNTKPYGIKCSKPVERLKEAVEIVRKLLSGDEVSYKGRHFKLKKALISPCVKNKSIPIWIGANSPKTISLTGKIGDGWLPIALIFPPKEYEKALSKIKNEAVLAGRGKDDVEPALFLHIALAKEHDKAAEMVKEPGKLLLLMWVPEVFPEIKDSLKNFHALRLEFNLDTAKRLEYVLKILPVEPVYERIVFGSPDECIEGIEKYLKVGVKHIVASILSPPTLLMNALKLYTEKVIPYFKGL